jgi:flagellar basal-body rod modification protein FlgD
MSAAAAIGAATGNIIDTKPTAPPSVKSDPLANEETFLKLLVSQLKHQDPLNPPDTSQFVGQLTAYSQLEQLIGIRQNTNAAATGTDADKAAGSIAGTTEKAG